MKQGVPMYEILEKSMRRYISFFTSSEKVRSIKYFGFQVLVKEYRL